MHTNQGPYSQEILNINLNLNLVLTKFKFKLVFKRLNLVFILNIEVR